MSGGRGRTMPRFWLGDDEMAKKDDDLNAPGYQPSSQSKRAPFPGSWQAASTRAPRRTVILRITIYVVLVLLLIFGFNRISNLTSPRPDVAQVPVSLEPNHPAALDKVPLSEAIKEDSSSVPPPSAPPSLETLMLQLPKPPNDGFNKELRSQAAKEPRRNYEGAIKYPALSETIGAAMRMNSDIYESVVFAVGSLRSAATLLPFACRMAHERKALVHFVFALNTDTPLVDVLSLNGIDDKCPLIVHDARPDDPGISTDYRMARATARALLHIGTYISPKVLFVDGTANEEYWFMAGVHDQVRSQQLTLIELPDRASQRLGWLTKLDAPALIQWNRVTFDIIVQAPTSGSDSMIRMLKSLASVDLVSVATPHLTIEMPTKVDKALEDFIEHFQWPPGPRTVKQPSALSIRRRISRAKATPQENSDRLFESFWPANAVTNHVVVLSPNIEISPHFFHYVRYAILHYRHSESAQKDASIDMMMGMGFGKPPSLLDGETPFKGPPSADGHDKTTPFRWQAPNNDAMLIFGQMWRELHNYVSLLTEKQASTTETAALLATKQVSDQFPAWLEHALQLSRLRGYYTLYPSPDTSDAILGLHKDLYKFPEEFQPETSGEIPTKDVKLSRFSQYKYTFDPSHGVDLIHMLPDEGKLKPVGDMPILSWDGNKATEEEVTETAKEYASRFRREVGGCDTEEEPQEADMSAEDLFCAENPSSKSDGHPVAKSP